MAPVLLAELRNFVGANPVAGITWDCKGYIPAGLKNEKSLPMRSCTCE